MQRTAVPIVLTWSLVSVTVLAQTGAAQPMPQAAEVPAKQLIEHEQKLMQAIVADDADAIAACITDDWCLIGPDGSILDRKTFLDLIRSGDVTHDTMQGNDWRVRVHGETAVVTAKTRSRWHLKNRTFNTYERSTSVYTKVDGEWKCLLTQLTALKERPAK